LGPTPDGADPYLAARIASRILNLPLSETAAPMMAASGGAGGPMTQSLAPQLTLPGSPLPLFNMPASTFHATLAGGNPAPMQNLGSNTAQWNAAQLPSTAQMPSTAQVPPAALPSQYVAGVANSPGVVLDKCNLNSSQFSVGELLPCTWNTLQGIMYDLKNWSSLPSTSAGGKFGYVFGRDDRLFYLIVVIVLCVVLFMILKGLLGKPHTATSTVQQQPVYYTYPQQYAYAQPAPTGYAYPQQYAYTQPPAGLAQPQYMTSQ